MASQWIVLHPPVSLVLGGLCMFLVITSTHGDGEHVRTGAKPSSIVFNNPKLLNNEEFDYDGYSLDSTQEEPDPKKLGGIVIQDEAMKLSSKLRTLSNAELGVMKMQVRKIQVDKSRETVCR